MAKFINEWEDLVDGEDGSGGITAAIETAIREATEDGVRVKIVFRAQDQGTPGMKKLAEVRFDPQTAQVVGVKRQIIQALEDNPGPEFSGKIRIDFQNGENSTSYQSFQRTIKIGAVAQYDPGNDEEGYEGNFADEVLGGGGGGNYTEKDRDEIITHYKNLLLEKDTAIKRQAASTDAAMGFLFKSQANMLAMFERSTRMMESYTLRFGFPQPIPQQIEMMGSPNREPAPQAPPAGGGGMGLLPMLLQAAAQFAKPEAPPAAPPPQPQRRQIPQGQPQGGRMQAVDRSASSVRSIRPVPAQPASGYEPAPPIREDEGGGHDLMHRERGPMQRRYEPEPEPMEDAGYESEYEEDEGSDEGGYGDEDGGAEEAAAEHLNKISADEMKALVVNWVNASPENKQAAMSMGPDLISAIMGG